MLWRAAALLAASLLLAAAGAAAASEAPAGPQSAAAVPANAATIRDFLIQNVCLDASGAVRAGASPLDGDGRCRLQRDLRPGENLPYHKHDHPAPTQRAGAPAGYQRHDSFPVKTALLGTVVEHSFDFGAGEGRHFGVFDTGSDGGDIAILSPGIVSFGATEDGGAGFQLFVGECEGPVSAAALKDSWIVIRFDEQAAAPLEGETVARLNDLTKGRQETCPSRFGAAYTRWRVQPFRYRAVPGQGGPVTLTTLVSEHYGGESPATADHVERFYFTRELGSSRWERWQNARGNRQLSADLIAKEGAEFAASGRCSEADRPAGGASFVLIDCREWTRIVPPADRAGDRPGFFIKELRSRPEAPRFFAPPSSR